MEQSAWRYLFAVLLLACLVSFAWAMQKFFVQPSGTTSGMKVTKYCSSASAILQLVFILRPHPVTGLEAAVALSLYLGALATFWWAIRTNRAQPLSAVFSPDVPVHLVTHGPYRWVRHPFYASYLMTWLAGVPASGQIWMLVAAIVMAVLYWRASGVEEQKFSGSTLALDYNRYRKRTGRFFPNPFASMRTSKTRPHAEQR